MNAITTEQFILSGSLSKSSKNENMSLNTVISGNKKLLPDDGVSSTVNLYEEYLNERKNSNKFRLIININPFCSNVLFNPFTEIVKYEIDSNNQPKNTFLNYNIISVEKETEDVSIKSINNKDVIVDEAIGKLKINNTLGELCKNLKTLVPCEERFTDDDKFKWTVYDAIRDTQLSNEKCGFQYYCGLDIFNNHLLRNKTFRPINYTILSKKPIASYEDRYGEGYKGFYIQGCDDVGIGGDYHYNPIPHEYLIAENFNTIDDYMRDKNGNIVSDYVLTHDASWSLEDSIESSVPLHQYQKQDILTFEDCVKLKLIERNGWFGFSNPSTFDSLSINDDPDGGSTTSDIVFNLSPNNVEQTDCESPLSTSVDIDLSEYNAQNQTANSLYINKTINNRKYCDFIDMYPTRELYSFTPLYNKTYKRYEKNWNYCLTYPSKSITKDFKGNEFPFFYYLLDGTISMKTVMFDEYVVDDDGRNLVTIYSIAQHGLKEGDNVNIYKSYVKKFTGEAVDELFYNNATVARIFDKYTFQIYKDSANLSNKTINIDEIEWTNGRAEIDGKTILLYDGYVDYDGIKYPVAVSNRCSIDSTALNVSFKRVVNNIECEYYVRQFSRLPNFKFADAEINDYNLYEDKELDLINEYSKISDDKATALYDFENHINSMSFAQTSYGDETTEIVYTDDIDISYLKDNLGRPLSNIYFTIMKNNKGYKKWYKNQISFEYGPNIDHFKDIEFSHCFGYNSSSFLFNEFYRKYDEDVLRNSNFVLKDVRDISAEKKVGLRYHNRQDEEGYFDDEMRFDEIKDYYGDICYYSSAECDEFVLQSVMGRFNTVQREMMYYPEFNGMDDEETDPYKIYNTYFNSYYDENLADTKGVNGVLLHDEILDDEHDVRSIDESKNMFENFNYINNSGEGALDLHHSTFNYSDKKFYYYNNMQSLREGYYYKMHYKIPLKTVSISISSDEGINYDIFSIEKNNSKLKIQTVNENDLSLNDKLTLYNKTQNKFYYLTVSEIYTKYYFECSVKNEDLSEGFNDEINFVDEVSLVKRRFDTPEYAKMIKDGSCRYYWRNIISNGIEDGDSKVYPFTNGAFYVNKQINFFLRRQDPHGENLGKLVQGQMDFTPKGEKLPDDYYDNLYYDSEEIETC